MDSRFRGNDGKNLILEFHSLFFDAPRHPGSDTLNGGNTAFRPFAVGGAHLCCGKKKPQSRVPLRGTVAFVALISIYCVDSADWRRRIDPTSDLALLLHLTQLLPRRKRQRTILDAGSNVKPYVSRRSLMGCGRGIGFFLFFFDFRSVLDTFSPRNRPRFRNISFGLLFGGPIGCMRL